MLDCEDYGNEVIPASSLSLFMLKGRVHIKHLATRLVNHCQPLKTKCSVFMSTDCMEHKGAKYMLPASDKRA